MFVRETLPDHFTEITDATPMIVINDTMWPASILSTWSLEELAVAHIYPVVPFVPPAGFKTTGSPAYSRDGNQVVQTYDTVPDVAEATSITRRQLILALWQLGYITPDEARAAATTGDVPRMLKVEFDKLEEPARTTAYITFASMSECQRNDPTLALVASANNISDAQMDDWFRWAATL